MFRSFLDWLDDRTGYRALLTHALEEPVPGGARWSYVFGSGLVVVLLIQMLTGIALGAYYSPSTTDAWASVNHVQNQVAWGWLVRGMHHFGASAMVILVFLHMLQTVWYGAFRAPREVNWITGFLLLQLVLGFALTGYLLPWDQKGYWATQVATSIAGTLPLIGESLQTLLQGGPSYGNLTLTRFYALHVFVLPAGIVLFTVAHVYLFRRHGVTPPPALKAHRARELTEPFWPGQFFKDVAFALAVLVLIVTAALLEGGAPLSAPADPSSQYLARPEWYFLPLFQLLKYFEGPAEIAGTVILPGLAMTFLVALPFLHALLKHRVPSAHRVLSAAFLVGTASVVALGALAAFEDKSNPGFAKLQKQGDDAAEQAQRLALAGVPSRGPLFLHENDPVLWGRKLVQQSCVSCHHPCSIHSEKGEPYKGDPCLHAYASRDWLRLVIRQPSHSHMFGNTAIDEMDAYTGNEESLAALTEFIYSQGDRKDVQVSLATHGEKLFDAEGCATCHGLDGKGTGLAPDLKGYASESWLTAFLRAPNAHQFYGEKNQMDRFGHDKLSAAEARAVVAYLRAQSSGVEYP